MIHRRFALLALFVIAQGCKCNPEPLVDKDPCGDVDGHQEDRLMACTDNTECADHYGCNAVKDRENLKCCTVSDRKCVTEADCCPGQTCPSDRKKCFDKFLSCTTDVDCGDKGDRFCETWTDSYGSGSRCRFHACSALGDCPAGQNCFLGVCLVELPCGGACDLGKACVPSIDRCQDYTTPTGRTEAACPVSCQSGFIATFNDNRNIWDTCKLPDVKCVCAELPPLRSEDLGRFSAIAADVTKSELLASGYDGQFGDLVVHLFGADGKQTRLDYVDGVPAGTAKYGPSGARHGVVEPGDDVGRYTDIAVNGERAYVSYYDVTNGDLKLAVRASDGQWTTMKVDGTGADLGLYTSIAIDSDGLPGISYFQRGGGADFDPGTCPAPIPTGDKAFITALKYAHAGTASPNAADFTITTIACQSRPAPACYACAQTCADPGSGPGCYAPATTCTTCDASTEACVTVGGTDQCAKKYNPANLAQVVDGVGLFTSLAYNGKDAHIAYMRRTTAVPTGGTTPVTDGDLYGVTVSAGGAVGTRTRLDASGDTGFFPSLKVDPATQAIAIAYHDFTSKKLKFWTAPVFNVGVTPEVIDTGAGAPGAGESNWVGTDSGLVFTGTPGEILVVYQDATRGDLKLAQRKPTWKVLPSLHTDGAVGFFADAALLNGKLYASHARIHAKLVSGEPHVDNSLVLDPYTSP
ncbi:MAG: hypothetical protein ACYC8T_36675 [Myxococcaceae bacterium]